MLKKLFAPLTTPTSIGVTVRYAIAVIGAVLSLLGIVGILTPEQIEAIKGQIDALGELAPQIVSLVGSISTIAVTIYAAVTKSSK